jgi:hypothetical protein
MMLAVKWKKNVQNHRRARPLGDENEQNCMDKLIKWR